ncbi:MAG: S41 family peptidase [Cyclobacteriaceae bacterium]|nr:S41 family peptidase [Cyclobacteriaceae bacterium]
MSSKNTKFQIGLPLLLALAIAAGMLIGATFASSDKKDSDLISGVMKFREILGYIERDYVDEVDTNELIENAITKMLEKLDPHSVYINSKDLEIAKAELEGGFDGIGVEFTIMKDSILVVAPLSGGPSEREGILPGDKIVEVDGENVASIKITNRKVFELLRGPKGSKVELGIFRQGADDIINFTITRDKIPQYSVDVSYMVDDEIGYLKISRFSATTYDEFKQAMKSLKEAGMKKLVLDLQGNPGGYMDKAVHIADEFLADNRMIVYTEGKQERFNSEFRAFRKGDFEDKSIIVLIDEGSASASEIVSGAIQDNDRGLVVGRRSFGKGLVQMPISLNDGSELRLTISRYYTPSGRSIQKPYSEDDDYASDLLKRFEKGEFFSADSIDFADSLQYKTTKGRIVYGGGGIMPDYFVPRDTTGVSRYMNALFISNTIREFVLEYVDENRDKLKKMEYEDYRKNFMVSDDMLNRMVELGKKNEVKYQEEQFSKSKDLMKLHLKAQIARSIWDNKGFYPIYNETNEVFQRALELFQEADALVKR